MNGDQPLQFYASKPRLLHMAFNIALAPLLLYLAGIWSWPPTAPHYLTFGLTGLIALRYARQRWHAPRLVVDADGIYCGEFYPWESIRNLQTVLRALRMTLMQEDGRVKDKVLNLGWASNADFRVIVQAVTERYERHRSK